MARRPPYALCTQKALSSFAVPFTSPLSSFRSGKNIPAHAFFPAIAPCLRFHPRHPQPSGYLAPSCQPDILAREAAATGQTGRHTSHIHPPFPAAFNVPPTRIATRKKPPPQIRHPCYGPRSFQTTQHPVTGSGKWTGKRTQTIPHPGIFRRNRPGKAICNGISPHFPLSLPAPRPPSPVRPGTKNPVSCREAGQKGSFRISAFFSVRLKTAFPFRSCSGYLH